MSGPPVPAVAPDPTPDQIAALTALQKEAEAYEASARDYRATITRIVQHHYEEQRRKILTALDRELDIERKGLVDARDEAIRKLEAFVARYSGVNAHPEETPDAMFRLAALYEEKVRANYDDVGDKLDQAIALYKRIITEFPKYRELAGVYYYLGHSLNDSNRMDEAQQVWRSLVCHNLYPYPVEVDPADPKRDKVGALPQDHDKAYWDSWSSRHTTPIGPAGGNKPTKGPAVGNNPSGGAPDTDETSFQDPYPDTCVMIPQKVLEGQDPRYIAEVWWLIGDYNFNEVSPAPGPFALNRAESAYTNSLKYKKPPIYGVAMYKNAWTYFKQQRYHASVTEFVNLLRYADEQEKLTGDAGADFRAEAFTYIAGSLTYGDFEGPGPDEPYIPRADILDKETDPKKIEDAMHVGIDRVQQNDVIPQNEKWTVDVYKALAQEYRELNQYRNVIEISELILKKWPLDRDAPVVQSNIADTYDTLMRGAREGTAEYEEYSRKALEARTALAKYVGTGAWTQANKDDPEALETAERLVRGGLRRAAADHTNAGRALANEGRQAQGDERKELWERALKEYQLAAEGWQGYLEQDENSTDAYESRFWLADAHHMVVVLTVSLDKSPTDAQIDVARKTAIAVRDSNEDSEYLQPAGVFVVDIAHQQLVDQYKRNKRSGGSDGIPERRAVEFTGEGKDAHYVKSDVPPMVLQAVSARDEYIRRVPYDADPNHNQDQYAFDAANYFFVYGQFEEAKKRFTPIYESQCGKTEFGYKAWDRLQSMANFDNNIEESRRLAEAAISHSCAITEEQKIHEEDFAKTTVSRGYYVDAAKAYEAAEKMDKDGAKPDNPERIKAWRKAGALYKVALEKAPARDEAPEAAIFGAKAFKQVGDYDDAIAMYELFIREYGNEENLTKLELGDKKAEPPVEPNPDQYAKRVENLKFAYDALSAAYVLFFNYPKAAETYDTISKNKRFKKEERRGAARNAVILYANIGDDSKMLDAQKTLYALEPPASEKAEIDYLVAQADLKRWDENGKNEGANKSAREKASASMEGYYNKNKGNADAAEYVIEAAYNTSKLKRAASDKSGENTWCQNTIKSFDPYKAKSTGADGKNTAVGGRFADMAAECAYRAVDQDLKDKFDYDTNHHRYTGSIDKVKQAFDKDLKEANDVWFKKLDDIIRTYESRAWSVAARSRQGSLYDSCRTGLYNATTATGVTLFTDQEEKLIAQAEESGREDLLEKVDALRTQRNIDWKNAKDKMLAEADAAMVKFYAESTVWARSWKVRNQAVDRAIQRLAFVTDILGNDKMRTYTNGIVDPTTKEPFNYQDDYFLRSRPGLSPNITSTGLPTPLPAAL